MGLGGPFFVTCTYEFEHILGIGLTAIMYDHYALIIPMILGSSELINRFIEPIFRPLTRFVQPVLIFLHFLWQANCCLFDWEPRLRGYSLGMTQMAQMTVDVLVVIAGLIFLLNWTTRSLGDIIYQSLIKYPIRGRPFMYWTYYTVTVECTVVVMYTALLLGLKHWCFIVSHLYNMSYK